MTILETLIGPKKEPNTTLKRPRQPKKSTSYSEVQSEFFSDVVKIRPELCDDLQKACTKRSVNIETITNALLRQWVNQIKAYKTYELYDVMNFGKYNGLEIQEVIQTDPRYVMWLHDVSERFTLSQKALDYVSEYMNIDTTGIDDYE